MALIDSCSKPPHVVVLSMLKDQYLLTCLIVNYNTSEFVNLTLEALAKLTRFQFKIIICDNGSKPNDLKKLKNYIHEKENITLIVRKQTIPGSIGHGEALDILVELVETPFFVTFDADATILKKDWDEILLSYISKEVKAVGTPPVTNNKKKPTDFPLAFVALYCTKTYKSLGCRFLPDKQDYLKGKDTGYMIRERFHAAGFKGHVLTDRNTRFFKGGPFSSILCAEYYDGKDLFACHFGRGSSLGNAKYTDAL